MKITELNNNNSSLTAPSDLVAKYLQHEIDGGDIYSFLQQFEFDEESEIESAIKKLVKSVIADKFVGSREHQKIDADIFSLYARFRGIGCNQEKFTKYPRAVAAEIWNGGYNRKRLSARTRAFYAQITPNAAIFRDTCEQIKNVYALTDNDINKIQFFVEQVKAGENFPNSLRRMLYIWGAMKMTGKSTTANALACLLNADEELQNISKYATVLANEMQIGSFKVPLISQCNACIMDECFYSDMGKTYADFKRFMTSSNGTARLPFGQPFNWYGQPNYIATSNDCLQRFIKDWDDRRYLSIEFKTKPRLEMSFAAIIEMWKSFILNSERVKGWKEWADEIAIYSNEQGERAERAAEFEIELQQVTMLNKIYQLDVNDSDTFANPANRIPLKWFIDFFASNPSMAAGEANKRRAEIEQAVLKVFGPRYSSTGYWLATDLKKRERILRAALLNPVERERKEVADVFTSAVEKEREKLPF